MTTTHNATGANSVLPPQPKALRVASILRERLGIDCLAAELLESQHARIAELEAQAAGQGQELKQVVGLSEDARTVFACVMRALPNGQLLVEDSVQQPVQSLIEDLQAAVDAHAQAQEDATQAPTTEELLALSRECEKMRGGMGMHSENYGRAVLARWGAQAQEDVRDAEPAGRSDAEIVAQTEELTKYLLKWKWGLDPESSGAHLRNSQSTKAQAAWNAACDIQELLTATDVESAVSEVDDAARAAQGGAA